MLLTRFIIKEQVGDCDDGLIFYLLMRVVEAFCSEYNRYPGTNTEMIESDIALLKRLLNTFLIEHRIQNLTIKEEFIHEM
jgi:hypothetical protein